MALSVKNMLGGSGGGASPFVWGKYDCTYVPPVDLSNPSFTIECNNYNHSITNADFDFTQIDDINSFLDGFSQNGTNYYFENDNGTLNFYSTKGSTEYPVLNFTITGSTSATFETNSPVSASSRTIKYDGIKRIKEDGTIVGSLVEYVTDKNPLKYPNGEVHTDGFFYRYANEGLYAWLKKIKSTALSVMNKQLTDIPYSYAYGSAVVYDGEIHILGSTNNYTYHYKFNGASWVSVSTLPYNFYQASAVVWNNEIHILGSFYSGNYAKHYKWNGTSWTSVSTLPTDFYAGSAVVYNNEIHILGGGNYNIHYKFDGAEWTSVSTLPYDFNLGSAVVYDNEIHILGSSYSGNYAKHYKWNGTSWTSVSTLPYYFYQGSALALDDGIHIYGSNDNGTLRTYHYKWNGTSWISVSTLPYYFYQGSAIEFNGESYILGGSGGSKAYLIDGFGWDDFDAIVSDDENAYPDGHEKDGYYYERASIGNYNMESGVVVPNSSFYISVEHNKGVKPSFILIFSKTIGYHITGAVYNIYNSDYAPIFSNSASYKATAKGVKESAYKSSEYVHVDDNKFSFPRVSSYSDGCWNDSWEYEWICLFPK